MKKMLLNFAVAAFTIAVSPISSFAQSQDEAPAQELPAHVTDYTLVEAPDDHVLGSEDAAITMIVWASVTCPHCGDWFTNQWPTVKSDLIDTGKLRFVFREFPTAPAQLAMPGFLLAACAPSEDYMSVIEHQMNNQDQILKAAQEGRGREAFLEIAKIAGMEDDDAITACLRNPDMMSHIQDNSLRADVAKLRGVPAFFVNGQAYKGSTDAESLVTLITDMDEKGLSELPANIGSGTSDHGHKHE